MFFIIILCILIILFFIPLPLKIKANYIDNKFNFYLYNMNLTDKVLYIRKKINRTIDKRDDEVPKIKNTLKLALDIMSDIKYKPSLKIKLNAIYGLDNAAYTALLHGFITSFYPILIQLINIIFNVRESNIKVHPEFNKLVLILEINSIIFVNLAKVIYISYIILKNLHKSKKMNLANT